MYVDDIVQATTRTQTTTTTTSRQQQHQQQQQALGASSLTAARGQNLSSSNQQLPTSGEDDKVVLTGLGLQTARVNEHAEFIIDGRSAGAGKKRGLGTVELICY